MIYGHEVQTESMRSERSANVLVDGFYKSGGARLEANNKENHRGRQNRFDPIEIAANKII